MESWLATRTRCADRSRFRGSWGGGPDGLTKKSIVTGPLLIAMGLSWYGYFELAWRSRLIIPLLMIFAGLLMLMARLAPLPERKERGLLAPREAERDRF